MTERSVADRPAKALPAEWQQRLRDAYAAYREAADSRTVGRDMQGADLAVLASAGRLAGWPLRSLAGPCGVSPERLRQIIAARAPETLPPDAPQFPPYRVEVPKAEVKRSHLTADEARELRDLAPEAKKNRGSQPLGSPVRQASELFSGLVIEYHERGVIWEELSDATRHWGQWPLPESVSAAIAEIRGHQRDLQKSRKAVSAQKAEVSRLKEDRSVSTRALRAANRELEELVAEVDRLDAISKAAEDTDLLPPEHRVAGLRMRAARHGYGKGAPPSIQPYRGVVVGQTKIKGETHRSTREPRGRTA